MAEDDRLPTPDLERIHWQVLRNRRRRHDETTVRRPIRSWEPRVQHSANAIANNPSSEAHAMDTLLERGCQCPPQHYLYDHDCRIPYLRLQCLREIHRWKQNRHLIEAMAAKLPKELVLGVLEEVALQTQSHLHFQHRRSLAMAARSIIGDSPVVDKLQPLAEEAIMNTSVISLNVLFQGDRAGKIAVLDPFVQNLPHAIRHFELRLRVEIQFERQQYPAALYSAAAGMSSLLSQLPRLQTFRLVLCVNLNQHPRDPHRIGVTTDFLNISCRKGFSGTSTFKQAIMDVLDAARSRHPGPRVSLELQYDHPERWRLPWRPALENYSVDANTRPAVEVVEEANAKHEW